MTNPVGSIKREMKVGLANYRTKKSSTLKLRQLEKYVKYFYMLFQKQIFVRNLSKLNTFLSFG